MSSANEILQAIADFFADFWSRYQLALDTEYGTALAIMTVLLAAAVLYLVIVLLLEIGEALCKKVEGRRRTPAVQLPM